MVVIHPMKKIAFRVTTDLPFGVQPRFTPISRPMKAMTAILMALLFHNIGKVQAHTPQGTYEVKLAWNASPSTDVTGHRIHYGTASRAYTTSIELGNVTTATVSGLAEGVTYYFAVSAVNAAALESDYSNEVRFEPGLHTSNISTNANGEPVLNVRGLIGHRYDIEASEDLKTWSVIDTITIPDGGLLKFADPDAPIHARRFYRTRVTP